MSDTPDANDDTPNASEPPTTTSETTTATDKDDPVERLKAEKAALEAQLKGQQRANERLRNDLKKNVQVEDLTGRLGVLSQSFEKFASILKEAGNEDMADAVEEVLSQSRTASDAISQETQAQTTIVDELGKVGIEWDDDRLKTARAYYESKNYDKAIEEVRNLSEQEANKTIEQRVAEELEKRLADASGTVTKTSGTKPAAAPAPLEGQDAIRAQLDSGDYDAADLLAKAAALARK